MNNKSLSYLIFCSVLIVFGCSKDNPVSQELTQKSIQSEQESAALSEARPYTQMSGIGYYAEAGEGNDAAGKGADFTIKMTGDLEGYIYMFVDKSECSGNGSYWEEGRELFVGTYKGKPAEYRTTYKFLGKYEGCANRETSLGAEILGFCDHRIVKGSGKGVLKGVTGGQYYMIDKVRKALKFPYEGQIKF